MCGILGVLPGIDPTVFRKALNHLVHRGPDHEGIWKNDNKTVQLGHRRLSIIDLSPRGHQPMLFDNLVIVYNGEVYNYIDLRVQLKTVGYTFTSDSDTEVVLKAYHFWGVDCFQMFNGMWALAIYDKVTKKLLLSRDRFGIKPLYYYSRSNLFAFGSEVRAIHNILGSRAQLDEEVLKEIAGGGFGHHGGNLTYLKEVRSVPSGSILELDSLGKVEMKQWYELKQRAVASTFSDQADELRHLLQDAIRLRMRSDVPLATCLSGGVDSGSIASMIHSSERRNGTYPSFTHQAFCASFKNSPIDESPKAQRLATQLGLKLETIQVPCPSTDDLEREMKRMDGPMNSLAFYPISKLYKSIHDKGIKVTLDGQGPDEMMGGYRPLHYALLAAIETINPIWLIDLYRTYAGMGETAQFSSRGLARKTVTNLFLRQPVQKLRSMLSNGPIVSGQGSGPEFVTNSLNRNLHYQFFSKPLPGILQQFDRCSMINSVECRMPFMDFRLVEYVFSLPAPSKVGHGHTKRVLRKAVEGVLPDETRLDRQKIGFNAPIVDWFKGDLKEWMSEIIDSADFLSSPYFDGPELANEFGQIIESKTTSWDQAWKLWGPVHITWWTKNTFLT